MRIIHVSDMHGTFPTLPDGDVVISSGDDLPNASRGNLEIEPFFQRNWIRSRLQEYKEWLGGKPFIRVAGNHDFCPMLCPMLNDIGIDANDITNRHYVFKGQRMYGFPYIPYIAGEWNFECTTSDMARQVRKLKDVFTTTGIDILVAHAPIANILDNAYGDHIGNPQVKDLFQYILEEEQLPKLYLHGHNHEQPGHEKIGSILVVNAATTVKIIEYTPSSGWAMV